MSTVWLIDIDGTVCDDIPNETPELFATAKPIPGSLEKVKELYETEGLGAAAKETLAQIPAAFGEQTPFIGSIVAGARLGLAVAGPYGAIAGSLLVPFLQASGGAMERKAQTQYLEENK